MLLQSLQSQMLLYRLKANYFGLIRIELKEHKRAYSAISYSACVTADRLPVRQYTTDVTTSQ